MATQGYRRALGQHFLQDLAVAQLIADTALDEARKHGCQALLEIGPGQGAITHPIAQRLARSPDQEGLKEFFLCERDVNFADFWATQGLRVEKGDFMEVPEERWLQNRPLAVVSNLPYSAGTAIANRLAQRREAIPVMVLMFQAEVAQRFYASIGTKAWGSLSLWIQNRWDVTRLAFVPPKAFRPPPKVNSEVIVMTRRAQPRIAVGDDAASEKRWESLLHVAFAHRRKMLRSGLPPGGHWRNALVKAELDVTKRAEALSWDEWRRFYEAVLQLEKS